MKHFFAYDDTKIMPIVLTVLASVFFYLIFVINDKIYTIIAIFAILFSIFGIIMIFLTGIHCNITKRTVRIIDAVWFRKIKFDDIQYVTFKKVEKERKKRLFPLFSEMPNSKWFSEPDYIYNNGEIFVVEFHLKNQQVEKSYYTWLFKAKSAKRVERQKIKLEQFISNLNCIIRQK